MGDTDAALRAEALERLLVEKGLIDPAHLDGIIEMFNTRVGPMNGARVVARAWRDPVFRQSLLHDGSSAIASYGFEGGQVDKLVVVENTPDVHNVVVCTLCSCYPWALLGLPPKWYKDPAYRSRIVREPRVVLREFGLAIAPQREIRVWDSSAEIRYMVLPMMPDRLRDADDATLLDAVSRDAMIGVQGAHVMLRIPDAGAAPPLRNGELDFEAPWQGRVFAMANALCEAGVFEWQEFQTALIRVIASSPVAEGQPYQYYNLFLAALESLLADKSVLRQQTIGQLVAELAARNTATITDGS